jgi:acyl dehydratase
MRDDYSTCDQGDNPMPFQPRGRTFEQFKTGDEYVCQGRTVTEADVVHFAGLSGDYNPLHTDEEFGKTTPFGGRIAHGVLILAIATGQINQTGLFEGTSLALLQQTIKYVGAVKLGDTVHLEFKVVEKKETSKPDRGILTLENRVVNQLGRTVIEVQEVVMVKRSAA